MTGGDDALLDELVALFPGESTNHLAAIRTAIASNDVQSLTRAAHTLKSAAKLFGAQRLAACALDLEVLGQSAQIEAAKARLPELQEETRRVIDALQGGKPDGRKL
jgi:HPt (histidine-containing phosphotransfer) domain-containing protein